MSLELNRKFRKVFVENVQDKGLFKAVFLAGGPGSGKDFVLNNILKDKGLTEVNIDTLIRYFNTEGHDFDLPYPEENSPLLKKVKNINELRQVLSINGRNGLVINFSGDNFEKTKLVKGILESFGYETLMIYVHVDDEVSRQRNINRSKAGSRVIPESKRRSKWNMVQENRQNHAKLFGDQYFEFDNSLDMRESSPEEIKEKKDELNELGEHINEFVETLPMTEKANDWAMNVLRSDPRPSIGGSRKLPNSNSKAYQEAMEMGLYYMGKGRYGKAGKATHYTFADNLMEIPEEEPTEKKSLKEFMEINFNESIDKGIEPGLSMAASGENFVRMDNELNIKSDGIKDKGLRKKSLKKLKIKGDG